MSDEVPAPTGSPAEPRPKRSPALASIASAVSELDRNVRPRLRRLRLLLNIAEGSERWQNLRETTTVQDWTLPKAEIKAARKAVRGMSRHRLVNAAVLGGELWRAAVMSGVYAPGADVVFWDLSMMAVAEDLGLDYLLFDELPVCTLRMISDELMRRLDPNAKR